MSGRRVLLVSSDLMVGSRLAGQAAACDATLVQRANVAAVEGPFHLVVLDLQGTAGDPAAAIGRLREAAAAGGPPPRIVAFGPHVATQLLEAARSAGADEVVSRGELLGSFAAILGRHGG